MFDNLGGKLQDTLLKLKKKGKLTEADIKAAGREIKLAMLEADVNYKVVKDFIDKVSARALGDEVMKSLTPSQQYIKIVRDEIIDILASNDSKLKSNSNGLTVILMAGIQGSGKTTTAAKLANILKKQNKKVLMAACDTYRPAAVKQLQTLGAQINIPVFYTDTKPEEIARLSIKNAKEQSADVLIIDTAGRMSIDEDMMTEISNIAKITVPAEILLCIDAMTGQDAVNTAKAFDERLKLSGIIMTKLDSDTRGGAALSVTHITGKPIKFCGTGEKISDIEAFNAERIAGRILGMGDILGLIEKAEAAYDAQAAQDLSRKIAKNSFTLEDFLEQLEQMQNMGGIEEMLKMMPGAKQLKGIKIDEKEILHQKAIIQSMTIKERQNPNLLNASRRRRIAEGSGTKVSDINKLINGYENSKKMMKQFSGKMGKKGKMNFPFM
ncbi:MAG: signal recognition particle protein [Eubacteriaceae bacterium]|nr:signal recognition particle protein [Eubacteriaceae bacterium]